MSNDALYRMIGGLLLLWTTIISPFSHAEVIHSEKSLYRNITVEKDTDSYQLCLSFETKLDKQQRRQSCKDLNDPKRLVFLYAHKVMSALFINPNPKKILVVGLGGGSLPEAFHSLLPNSHIDVVEIDSAVVNVAERFFAFKETERMYVYVQDARVFIKRAKRQGKQYDMIVLDAFTGDYIPEHLMTQEFLQETKDLLSEQGLVVANTFSSSQLYDYESATYQSVFGPLFNVKSGSFTNRVVIGRADGSLPSLASVKNQASQLSSTLKDYGVDTDDILLMIKDTPDWDTASRILTDQYSPANLLKALD